MSGGLRNMFVYWELGISFLVGCIWTGRDNLDGLGWSVQIECTYTGTFLLEVYRTR